MSEQERPDYVPAEFAHFSFYRCPWAPDWFKGVPPGADVLVGAQWFVRRDGMTLTLSSDPFTARPKDIRAAIEEFGATASAEVISEEIYGRTREWLESFEDGVITDTVPDDLYPDDGIW